MPVDVILNTPLAEAINMAIQPKVGELGWTAGGIDEAALAEYVVLMLVNGKSEHEIASELSGDLLNLGSEDPGARDFAAWLFVTVEALNAQQGGANAAGAAGNSMSEAAQGESMDGDMDTDMTATDGGAAEPKVPTGPKSMRGGSFRGGRARMVGQINRTMDRTQDSVLHRVRGQNGNERIAKTPPTGPRMGTGRQPRVANNRAANVNHHMANGPMGGPHQMNGMNNNWNMPGQTPQEMNVFAMLEQQQQMIQQMLMQQQAMAMGTGTMGNGAHGRGQGKSLSERIQRPHNNRGRGGHHQQNDHRTAQSSDAPRTDAPVDGEDTDMSQPKRDPPNPEETVCKFNLSCTNKECKFAHQSPAAPPGTTVDIKDVCSFGVACKNFKCTGRHPSPATKVAHQSEQDCKFYPNCQNPRCPFRHPAMPPCRNGGECKVPNCKFTHLKTACKFRPCTNRFCPFSHEEGQRGTFHDKVWVADEANEHMSERKFVDENATEDLVLPGVDSDIKDDIVV